MNNIDNYRNLKAQVEAINTSINAFNTKKEMALEQMSEILKKYNAASPDELKSLYEAKMATFNAEQQKMSEFVKTTGAKISEVDNMLMS